MLTAISFVSFFLRSQGLLYIPLLAAMALLVSQGFSSSLTAYLLFFHGVSLLLDFPLIHSLPQIIPLYAAFAFLGNTTPVTLITLFLLLTAVGVLHYYLELFIADHEETCRELEQSRWSASELPQVLLKIGDSVKKARNQGRMNERVRVAREVHDTVGYTLTALISQVEVIRELMDEGALKERVTRLESLSRKSLQNIRKEVDNLRNEEEVVKNINWEDRFHQLCDVFQECTGIRIDHRINNGDHPFHDEIGAQVSRILQEALTNAYRHGKASLIDVAISYKVSLKLYLIRVSDNGIGQNYVTPGNGLKGIHERVTRLRGEVKYETRKGKGFDIGIDIPYNMETESVNG